MRKDGEKEAAELDNCGVTGLKVPNPYSPDFLTHLYDKAGLHNNGIELDVGAVLGTWSRLARQQEAFAMNCESLQALNRLIKDGLLVNNLGMDFSKVQAKRYGPLTTSGEELSADSDVQQIRKVFFPSRVHDYLWRTDMTSYYKIAWPYTQPPIIQSTVPHPQQQLLELAIGLSTKEEQLLASFRRDGFVKIDSFEGLDRDALEREARPFLGSGGLKLEGGGPAQALATGSLKRVLDDDGLLKRLARGYLGADAEYHGLAVFRLVGSYMNTAWHHDGCGSRLKAFIYASDVDENAHPTQVMAGTNHFQWYGPTHFFVGPKVHDGYNKLNSTLVDEAFSERKTLMTGKIGGGFIFDTNTIHGHHVPKIPKARDVIIMEFATKAKYVKAPSRPNALVDEGGPVSGYETKCGGP
jgi:hypothetical protein